MNVRHKILENLKNQHSELKGIINGTKVALIDIPVHYNTGDILIYKGEERFFIDHDICISYRALQNNIDHKELTKCDVILIHGGGNFGDIYLDNQRERERILSRYVDKKIIFLPQSIYFKSSEELEITKQFFSKMVDITICVRDIESYDVACTFSDRVLLLPDMAHSLYPLLDESEVGMRHLKPRVLNLIRNDIERDNSFERLGKQGFDWNQLLSGSDHIFRILVSKSRYLPWMKKRILNFWLLQLDSNYYRAVEYVDNFDVVHTDRLHGYILAFLLGKDVVLYDNNYKKIERYKSAWINKSN